MGYAVRFKLLGLSARMKHCLCLFILGATQAACAEEIKHSHMRGERYCEIIFAKKLTRIAIYNTLGLNDCPKTKWDKITNSQVKQETGSLFVYLNGPRYWVIDGFDNRQMSGAMRKTISGIDMQEAGLVHIRLADLFKAKSHYYQHEVTRQTTWLYKPGKPIYELIDDQGQVYVMQSYSTLIAEQTENSLLELGTKLDLPKGWSFKTGILKQVKSIQATNNLSVVILDNFDNIYQKVPHDFLNKEQT